MTPERKAQGLLEVADQLRIKQEEFSKEQGVTLHGETGNGGEKPLSVCDEPISPKDDSVDCPGDPTCACDGDEDCSVGACVDGACRQVCDNEVCELVRSSSPVRPERTICTKVRNIRGSSMTRWKTFETRSVSPFESSATRRAGMSFM